LSGDRDHTAPVALETRDLTKVYGSGDTAVRALDGVSLAVGRGQSIAIMGPSGSGKSTLLHLLGALDTPTSGEIRLGGERYDGLGESELTALRRDRIGFVFQFFNLLPSLSAEENVLLPALIAGRRDSEVRERARGLLERVGLGARVSHLPGELSGGEQQRVSIADEPTGNLDTHATDEILELLRELNADEGQTLVIVSHDPAAAATAARVVFLRDGRAAGEIPGGSTERVIRALSER
jgi:putative ABC transport system ATP-binding protein